MIVDAVLEQISKKVVRIRIYDLGFFCSFFSLLFQTAKRNRTGFSTRGRKEERHERGKKGETSVFLFV